MICNEIWLHSFTPESKHSSTKWHHKGLPLPEIFKMQPSVGKIIVFQDSEGVIHIDFLSVVQ
jgi:hypothetical protein